MKTLKLTSAQQKLINSIKESKEEWIWYNCRQTNTVEALLRKGIIKKDNGNGFGSYKISLVKNETEEKPLTLKECRADYVLAYDKNGMQQRVKRGKELIKFMIKNS